MTRRRTLMALTLSAALSTSMTVAAQRPVGKSAALAPQDYLDIQQLVVRYAYALDTGADNGYMYADLFTPDGEFSRPYAKGREQLAALARLGPDSRRGPLSVSHFVTNHLIEPSGEGATGKVYLAIFEFGEGGKPNVITQGGHYEDVYVKTAAGWRFRSRDFVPSRLE